MIFIKRFIKILLIVVVVLVSLQAALLIVLQFPAVQTAITRSVAKQLSGDSINGKLSIGKVYFVFFNKLILTDVSIVSTERSQHLDSLKLNYNQSDTLVAARKVSVSLLPMELMKLNLQLGNVTVSDGVFNLQDEGERTTNLDRIFNLGKSTEKDTTQSSFSLKANSLKVNNFRFTLNNPEKAQFNEYSIINFSNLRVRDIFIDLSDISLQSDTLRAAVNDIRGVDISGFRLKTLNGDLMVCGTETLVSDLFMQDNYSTVDADYFSMRYDTSKDFSDFTQKVRLGAKFTGSFLDFHTIGRISSTMYNSNLGFGIDGEVNGPVKDLRTDNLRVTSRSGLSFIDLSAKIIGLPDVSRTMAIAQIKNSGTMFMDLAKIVASIDNTPVNRFLANMAPLTPYRFKGTLSGLLVDFVADGTITSPTGNVDVDFVFRTEPEGARFIGDVQAHDLHLGKILVNDFLGELSFNGKADAIFGSGENSMRIFIDSADVYKAGINGYNYSNIVASGELTDRAFNGSIISNDPNLSLVYNGLLTFSMLGESKYDFTAQVNKANLKELNIDTGTEITGISFNADASFTNKDNNWFNGKVDLENINYNTQSDSYKLGNLSVNALSTDSIHNASLVSDFALLEYEGASSIPSFISKVRDITASSKLDNYLSYDPTVVYKKGFYTLNLETFDSYDLTKVLVPGLFIMDSTKVAITIDKDDKLNAVAQSGRIAL